MSFVSTFIELTPNQSSTIDYSKSTLPKILLLLKWQENVGNRNNSSEHKLIANKNNPTELISKHTTKKDTIIQSMSVANSITPIIDTNSKVFTIITTNFF